MSIVGLLNHVGIECDYVTFEDRREGRIMANEVNSQGIAIPQVSDTVVYVPEAGLSWAAIVTGIEQDTMIYLTAFPPGEPPRGIQRPISYDYAPNRGPDGDTWHWRTDEVPQAQNAFAELPDLSNDAEARQNRIEELGG